jgi:hypothetical protein
MNHKASSSKKGRIPRRPHIVNKLTSMFTQSAILSINAQTILWWVFGSTAPGDVPTAKYPWLCLAYTFKK